MILIKNSENYPLFVGDLLSEYPEWNSDDEMPPGWELVVQTEKPTITSGYKLVELFPVRQSGVWNQSWDLVKMTQDELESMSIKDILINPEIS